MRCTAVALVASFLASAPARAARPDGQLWTEAGIAVRVERDLEVRFEQHLRLDHNGTRANEIMPEVGVRLRLGRHLRLGAGYRLIESRTGSNAFRTGHRMHIDLRGRLRLGDVRLELRERFQQRFDNRGNQPALRHRLAIQYRGWRDATADVSLELFNRYGARNPGRLTDSGFRMHKWRLSVGTTLAAGDHELDLGIHSEWLDGPDAPRRFIVALGFHLDADARPEVSAEAERGSRAISINLVGPAAAAITDAAGLPLADANVSYARTFGDTLGMKLTAELGYAKAPLSSYQVGVKGGPRLSLSGDGLAGWYLLPLGVAGATWMSSWDDERLRTAAVLGAGIEGGYAWRWDALIVEAGAGVFATARVGADAAGFAGVPIWTVGPLVNVSIGYAW